MNAKARIVVSGSVQGVGFRYFIQHYAQQLELSGWVKNLPSGEVEIDVEGGKELIEQLMVYAMRGPRSAVVSNVQVDWQEYRGEFQRFAVAYS